MTDYHYFPIEHVVEKGLKVRHKDWPAGHHVKWEVGALVNENRYGIGEFFKTGWEDFNAEPVTYLSFLDAVTAAIAGSTVKHKGTYYKVVDGCLQFHAGGGSWYHAELLSWATCSNEWIEVSAEEAAKLS